MLVESNFEVKGPVDNYSEGRSLTSLTDGAFDPPLVLYEPHEQYVPLIFSVPHSGCIYPDEFIEASRLSEQGLRRSEDAFVDVLFKGMVSLGAPVLCARFPRAYLDVNREPYELEPRLFEGKLPPYANTRSVRVLSGLGTIPRIVADGFEIYHKRLPVEEGLRRIETLYRPYHAALQQLINQTIELHGMAILIDCHSMPSGNDKSSSALAKPDVVLGDRYGTSCSGLLTDSVSELFINHGYTTVYNEPYAGGFITEFYGEPAKGCHALQIEINRGLYMDEESLKPLPRFTDLASDLFAIFSQLARMMSGEVRAPYSIQQNGVRDSRA